MQNTSVDDTSIMAMDFTSIEEMDPSLADGFHIIYSREVPIEVRTQVGDEDPEQGTLESIHVKMLALGQDNDATSALRIEFTSEVDLFFHYVHYMDELSFKSMVAKQNLMLPFQEYPNVLIRMLNSVIREPATHLAILVLSGDKQARLDIIQNMEYKFVELMSCDCEASPEQIVQHHITYRYDAMKQRLGIMQGRLQEINNLVKLKNPSLLIQLQKGKK